jgi:hypothetical protein
MTGRLAPFRYKTSGIGLTPARRHANCWMCAAILPIRSFQIWIGDAAMYPNGQVSWPLLLATVAVVLAAMAAFQCSDWGHDTAMRIFLWPIENAARLAWR